MNSATLLRAARERARLSLRALAERAGTSHATLAAYEAGRVVPRVDTFVRIIEATGHHLEATLAVELDGADDRSARGRELLAALELAAMFPAEHARRLDAPVFARHR